MMIRAISREDTTLKHDVVNFQSKDSITFG